MYLRTWITNKGDDTRFAAAEAKTEAMTRKICSEPKAKTAAKISVVKYIELTQQLHFDKKPAEPGG